MKLTIFVCLVALAAAVPDKDATILLDERSDQGDGNFRYEFETSNGIYTQKTGTPGSEGQSNHQGAFRFTLEDGTIAEVSYIADEYGYQPSSDLLPVGPPAPPHVQRLLDIAAQQRAQGITFERK
ncbi:cuticle protein AMP1B-like [Homarus americanus]|uniref:cuticle protein AMP1B-like n=1 Tax=Homarus americanus TaxID=6706 RepID=UPI001C45CAFB|nr:cuticle protein AMP1B-like [Homarus americanus]